MTQLYPEKVHFRSILVFDQNVKNGLKDAEFAGDDMNCQKKC